MWWVLAMQSVIISTCLQSNYCNGKWGFPAHRQPASGRELTNVGTLRCKLRSACVPDPSCSLPQVTLRARSKPRNQEAGTRGISSGFSHFVQTHFLSLLRAIKIKLTRVIVVFLKVSNPKSRKELVLGPLETTRCRSPCWLEKPSPCVFECKTLTRAAHHAHRSSPCYHCDRSLPYHSPVRTEFVKQI